MMAAKKGKATAWAEVMDQVVDLPALEQAKPLFQRVAEAEELLAHPELWGTPVQLRMGRPLKGEVREEVENMSFRAPRALKEAFAAAAETQGIAPSEVLRMLAAAYVQNISPKARRKAAPVVGKAVQSLAKPPEKRTPRRTPKA
jgi:hypothetical protein